MHALIILFYSVEKQNKTNLVNAQCFGGSYNKLANFVRIE